MNVLLFTLILAAGAFAASSAHSRGSVAAS
jgi:hypothetical protein